MTWLSEVLAAGPAAGWRMGDTAVITAVSASSSFSSLPATNAFDGNPSTSWATASGSTGWLQAQLTSAVVLTSYSISRENFNSGQRMPRDWTLKGSNDGSTWTVIDTRTGITWPTVDETKTFTFSNSTAYSYYRLDVTANNGDSFLSVSGWILGPLSAPAVVSDASGNNRHAWVYAGGITPGVAGALGGSGDTDKAMTFNGSSGHADVPYASWMALNTAFSLIGWVKTTATGVHSFFDRDNNSSRVFQFRHNSGSLEFVKISGPIVSASQPASINDGNWHFVCVTYDGSNIRLYKDGALLGSPTAAAGTLTGTDPITIGANGSGLAQFFSGSLDEFWYYPSTVLSASQIASMYTAATTSPSTAGTASLSLSASGGAVGAAAGTAALSLSASGSTSAPVAGTAILSLSATGALTPPTPAAGTASLSLSAAGAASGSPAGAASLNLIATGTALTAAVAAGAATLSLSASGSAVMSTGGTATLDLSAVGIAAVLFLTDTSNQLGGRSRGGYATVTTTRPVAPAPPGRTYGQRVDKTIAYPTPVMVDGRPT